MRSEVTGETPAKARAARSTALPELVAALQRAMAAEGSEDDEGEE